MNPTIPKIVVGYRTRPVELAEPFKPVFTPPANYKDAAKISEWLAQREAEWADELLTYPYLATFDEVFAAVIGPGVRDVGKWSYRPPGSGKPPVCLAIRSFLMKHFGEAWAAGGGNKPVFIGFDPRTFLKIWGLECSLPENAQPLPPAVWYGTSQHRDIGDALLPAEYKFVPLAQVLRWRQIDVPGWAGPGADPELDTRVATIAAEQLGFLAE